MDGNGRWAIRQGAPRWFGHRAGVDNLRRIVQACLGMKVRYLTVYAFSHRYYSPRFWPDFDECELKKAFRDYQDRLADREQMPG